MNDLISRAESLGTIKAERFMIFDHSGFDKITEFCKENRISKENIIAITEQKGKGYDSHRNYLDVTFYTVFYEVSEDE